MSPPGVGRLSRNALIFVCDTSSVTSCQDSLSCFPGLPDTHGHDVTPRGWKVVEECSDLCILGYSIVHPASLGENTIEGACDFSQQCLEDLYGRTAPTRQGCNFTRLDFLKQGTFPKSRNSSPQCIHSTVGHC